MRSLVSGFCLLFLFGCSGGEPVHFADGSKTLMGHWDGRWLVINYWAEWCAPCREEIPELNELHHDRTKHGLVMLGVNWDGLQGDKLADVVERMNVQFPTLRDDPYEKYGYERAQQLPATVLINPARQVHKVLIGPQTIETIKAHIEL